MRLGNWDGLPHNAEDIARKFENTYVVALLSGQRKVVHLSGFGGHGVTVTRADNMRREMYEWEDLDVVESFPNTIGAVPFRNGVLFIKRTAARQWSVGLGSGTGILWDHNFKNVTWDLEKAQALYEPRYERLPIYEAVKKFEEKGLGLVGYAIDSTYWLARRDDKIVLYRNRNKMGAFTYGAFFRHGSARDFDQELWDDLRLKAGSA